jgi:hypothetical protein
MKKRKSRFYSFLIIYFAIMYILYDPIYICYSPTVNSTSAIPKTKTVKPSFPSRAI